MQPSISSLLTRYSHVEYPEGLVNLMLDCDTRQKGDNLQVQITVPFACEGIADDIARFLSAELDGQSVAVELDCQLQQNPCFKGINNIVLVASGKGGVGKSTTAVNLALGLAKEGAKVGLVDADVYGPSLPIMLGMQGQRPISHDGKTMVPLQAHGVKVNSIGFLIKPEDAAVWRGPMAGSALVQLIGETDWGELDYLIVDMPPGTGDIQLTISQKFPCTGAVVVTTPQNIALADAEKGVAMFNKVNIPVIGIIENMSYFQCSQCGSVEHIFGTDGAVAMAQSHGTVLLGQVPLEKQHRENADNGIVTVMQETPMAKIYQKLARSLSKQLHHIHQSGDKSGPEISFID